MNIFYVHKDPKTSAQMLCDKHVVKMVTESAQILSNVIPPNKLKDAPLSAKGNIRKYSYPKHPCCLWACESPLHAKYVIDHGLALAEEKLYRYPDNPRHFSEEFLKWVGDNYLTFDYKHDSWNSPPQCMPDEYKADCAIHAYWNYYLGDKHRVANSNETIKTKMYE